VATLRLRVLRVALVAPVPLVEARLLLDHKAAARRRVRRDTT